MRLELLQNRPTAVSLLVQDDYLTSRRPLQRTDGVMQNSVVMAMYNEDWSLWVDNPTGTDRVHGITRHSRVNSFLGV